MPQMIGRNAELAALLRVVDSAAGGRPSIVRLRGSAGIGKTTLLAGMVDQARARGIVAVSTRMSGPGAVEPYRPAAELVNGLLEAQPEPERGLFARLRERVNPNHLEMAAEVMGLVGLNLPAAVVKMGLLLASGERKVSLDRFRQDRVGLLSELVLRGADRPLLLVLDDVQWLDTGTAEVLAQLVRAVGDGRAARLAVALAWRPADAPDGPLAAVIDRYWRTTDVVDIELPGLDADLLQAAGAALLGRPVDIPRAFARWLAAESEGNPLRLRTLLSVLDEWGVLAPIGGALRLAEPFAPDGAPPPSLVRAMDALRRSHRGAATELVSLPSGLRRMLEAGALWGPAFPVDPVLAVAGLSLAEGHEVLREGLRRGLLREASPMFVGATESASVAFASEQHRAWLTRQVPEATRRVLHAGIAAWWGDRADELLEDLRAAWDLPEHAGESRGATAAVRALTATAERLATHLQAAGRTLDALERLVVTAEALERHRILPTREDATAGERRVVNVLLPYLDQVGARAPDLAQQQRWRPDVLRARTLELRWALAAARAYLQLECHAAAGRALEHAAALADTVSAETDLARRLLITQVDHAFATRRLDAARAGVRAVLGVLQRTPEADLSDVVLALHGWPRVRPVVDLIDWLTAARPDAATELVGLRAAGLRESLWTDEPTDEERAAIERWLADGDRAAVRALWKWVEGEIETSGLDDDDNDPTLDLLRANAAFITMIDGIAAAATRVGDEETRDEAERAAYARIRSVHVLATPAALREFGVSERRRIQARLDAPPFSRADRQTRFDALRGRLPTAGSHDLRICLVEDDLLPLADALRIATPLLHGAPTNERCCLADALLGRADSACDDMSPVARWLGETLDEHGLDGDSRAAAGITLADHLARTGRPGEATRWRMRLASWYDDDDPGVADWLRDTYGLPGGRPADAPPDAEAPVPLDLAACDEQAERALATAQRTREPEVAEAWFARAIQLLDRLPDGAAGSSRVHELAAKHWYAYGDDLDDDAPDEALERVCTRAGWHLAEAIRRAAEVGDVERCESLEDDRSSYRVLIDTEDATSWNAEIWARIDRMLARGDTPHALLYLESAADILAETDDLDEVAEAAARRGLALLATCALQACDAQGEPWIANPYRALADALS